MTKPLIADPAPASTGAGARGARRGGAGAVGLVLGGAVSVQAGAAVAALLLPRAGVAGVVTLRLVIAALLLLVVCRPRLRGHTARDWLVVGAFGVALAGMNALIYQAIERIPLGVAVTVEVLGPLVLSVITGRRASSWLWAALALGGVVLLGRGGVDGLDPAGIGFAVGAAAMWAAYILLSARTGARFPKANGLALAMTVAAILTLPWGVTASGAALLDPVTAGLGAAVAVLSSVLPYTLELLALRRMPTSTFAVLMSLGPAIAALAGYLVLDQALAPVQLLAIGLVIAATAGAVHTSNNNELRPNPAPLGDQQTSAGFQS
jgi:inner membrane transporter RhtA